MKQKDNNQVDDLISVIIPVYNVQDYLPRCLDSVINNSYRNLEIICVNDGSTDRGLEILRDYEKKDSRIYVFSKKNGGISSARNEGLKHCTGKWVAFIDSDDWIHKDYFKVLLDHQKENDYDVVVCNYIRTSDDNSLEYEIHEKGNYVKKVLDRTGYMSSHVTKTYVWGKLYRRTSLEGILFDEQEKIEDAWFNMQFVFHNKNMRACFIDIPLYGYYVRANSLISYIDRFCVLKLSQKCFQCAQDEKDAQMRDIFYLECLKRGLSARYAFDLYGDKTNVKICSRLLKNSLMHMKTGKMKYMVFVYCPLAYRLFRIIDDPTMLKYEKRVRESTRK